MQKNISKFFIDKNIPFIESRFSNSSKSYKEHIHETFSIGAIIDDSRIFTCKNNSYELKKNMLAIINPNTVHSCNCKSNNKNEVYMVYLDLNWCLELQKSIDPSISEFKMFSKDLLENKFLYEEFIKLNEVLFSNEFHITKECKTVDFFKKLFEMDINNNQIENYKDKDLITPIIHYLEKNYKNNISLKELENSFNLNSFYIIRLFNNYLSLSPHQYLLNLKINKSKELLKNGEKIVDVALECGFTDQSHFHRNFVNIVAITPKQYQVNFIQ